MLELVTLTLTSSKGAICLAVQCHETGKRLAIATEQANEDQIRPLVRHAHAMKKYGFNYEAVEACLMRIMRRTMQGHAA
jgi:hypothetical protein